MPRTNTYAAKRAAIISAIGIGGTDSQIARRINCSREYVRMVRASLGLPASTGSTPGRGKIPVPPTGEDVIAVDGGVVAVEPASEGRALLTVHEQHYATAVVRLTQPQLVDFLEHAIAVLESMPVKTPDVVGSLDDLESA